LVIFKDDKKKTSNHRKILGEMRQTKAETKCLDLVSVDISQPKLHAGFKQEKEKDRDSPL
jgi:hypothetical protein